MQWAKWRVLLELIFRVKEVASGISTCASLSLQEVAFDLDRNLLYVVFDEVFVF